MRMVLVENALDGLKALSLGEVDAYLDNAAVVHYLTTTSTASTRSTGSLLRRPCRSRIDQFVHCGPVFAIGESSSQSRDRGSYPRV
jgi:ABC-type amino acid transport substrate-binding protein